MYIRLDKLISAAGICPRSKVRALLPRITVNGCAALSSDMKVDAEADLIIFDGKTVEYKDKLYYMLNKPAGCVSATEDAAERTVMDLFPQALLKRGLFPAGRLDKDTEGLLIITNDGDYAHRMMSPKHHVSKVYYALTETPLNENDAKAFAEGMILRDGTVCIPAEIELGEKENSAYITLREGKYHQVKRMCAACGKPVVYLKRVQIGELRLDKKLAPGEYRELLPEEVALSLKK